MPGPISGARRWAVQLLASTASFMVVAARVVQGIGGGELSPTTLGIITTTYTKESERSRALGVWSALAGSGGAVGAVAGGLLTDLLSWRWVLGLRADDAHADARCRADRGVLAIERRSARPMMPLPVIRRPTVHLPVTVSFLFGAASFSTLFFLSLYLQRVLGYSALRAGFGFLPLLVASVVGSVLTGRLLRVLPARLLILAGIVLQIVGNGWLSMVTVSGSYATHVLVATIAAGLGVGLIMVALTAVTMAGVSPKETGLISGLLNTGRQFGGAVGLAVLSTVAASRTTTLIEDGSAAAPALTSGYARALLCAAIGMGIALAACLLMARKPRVRATQTAVTDREVADSTATALGGAVAQTEVR